MREKQIKEAVERMKMLNIFPATIREFENEGIVNLSEGPGLLYWLNDEEKELAKKIEERVEGVVYHAIKQITEFGDMYSFLYVSNFEEEWEADRNDISEGFPIAAVVNGEITDFGSIGIEKMNGGLVRIY